MTNLPAQIQNGTFDKNPALKKALTLALNFLSHRFDVYKTFDHEDDDLTTVEDHVTGKNLPPIVVNPKAALAVPNDKHDIVASVHCDVDSEEELRERTHIVDQFENVSSDVGIVVSFDKDLVNELEEVSKRDEDDVLCRLLICFTAICYLHELAHTKVAAFLVKDRSLKVDTPEQCRASLMKDSNVPEAGFTAECLILGCILEAYGIILENKKRPYFLLLDGRGNIQGMSARLPSFNETGAITVPFIEHIEAVLSGDLSYKEKDATTLEREARELLQMCPPLPKKERTPREHSDRLLRMSQPNNWPAGPKSKSSSFLRTDDELLLPYSSRSWQRAPKSLHVHTEGVVIAVTVEDDGNEPFEFSIRALGILADGSGQASLRRTNAPRQKCLKGSLFPATTILKGKHKFRLDELYEIDDTNYEEFLVIVAVGSEKASETIKRC